MEPRQSKLEIEQKVLKSLFNVHEERQMRMDTHGHMDWRKVVKKLQNGLDFQLHSRAMPASWQKPQDGIILKKLYVSFRYFFAPVHLTTINIK